MNVYTLIQQAEIKQQDLMQDASNERLIREINRTHRANRDYRPALWQRVRLYLTQSQHSLPVSSLPAGYSDLHPVDQEG